MPKGTPSASLHAELAELYDRAQRAIDQCQALIADHQLILWWYGMHSPSKKTFIDLIADFYGGSSGYQRHYAALSVAS
jgi:hypothetical protein